VGGRGQALFIFGWGKKPVAGILVGFSEVRATPDYPEGRQDKAIGTKKKMRATG